MFLNHKDNVYIETQIHTSGLAWQLSRNLNYADLRDLILEIDANVADYDFTVSLHAALGQEIAEEDANG